MVRKANSAVWLVIMLVFCLGNAGRAVAGGGGENMLLVVNPNDPNALQIANAYAALRDIPAKNIEYIVPPPDYETNGIPYPISQAEVSSYYLNPISSYIKSQGLTNQINYIGTIGQATCYATTPISGSQTSDTNANSLNYALDLLTPLTNGSGLTMQNAMLEYAPSGDMSYIGPISGLYDTTPSSIAIGSNPAILHSASYPVSYLDSAGTATTTITTQYYMSGTIGYTDGGGNTAAQVIASLQSAAASDGQGWKQVQQQGAKIYFEDNGDVRSTTRDGEWPATESQLTARGIPSVYEDNTSGATPLDRNNVLGAVCGLDTLTLPNGSTYLPGSWADNLTSYGCDFSQGQTKATAFIAAGAAGTTGSVVEPYAIADRFTNSSIYTFIADGSTLGEAFAKSVASPDVQMPLGDMLAQPFAAVPTVTFNSGPSNYGAAAGAISISGSAVLLNSNTATGATGISSLELLIDGLVSSSGTLAGGSGTFNLNTAGLSDGAHEVRIVGINNSQAASEGYASQMIMVDNHGRSINFNGGNLTLTSSAATIGLSVAAGDGAVSQVELTCLGRVVAQGSGGPGALSLNPNVLAPGDNVIVPVAVFSDGTQVAGAAFVAHVESGPVNGFGNGAGTWLWSNTANWTSGALPQNNDGVARFGGAGYPLAGGGGTVTVDASASAAEIDLDNSGGGGYTIAALPGQTLTLTTSNGALSECLINVLSGSHTISAPLVLAAAGNLVNVTNPADCLTISGSMSGIGAVTKTGSGLLLLTSNNTYSGATMISAGTLQLGNGGAAGTLGQGTVTDNGALVFDLPAATTFGGGMNGVGSLTQVGASLLTLAGSNGYSGGTTVSAGAIALNNANAVQNSTVTVGVNNGLLFNTNSGAIATFNVGGLSGSGNINLADGSHAVTLSVGGNGARTTYSGLLGGAGGLAKVGSGILDLGANNIYSGATTVASGELVLDFTQPSALTANIINYAANVSTLVLSGGVLAIRGNANTANSQQFNGLAVNPGASAIVLTAGASNSLLLSMGSISRSTGGTVDFTLPSGTQSASNGITTTTPNNSAGILGGYATVNGTNWASSAGTSGAAGNITAYSAYARGNLGTLASAGSLNVSPSGAQTAINSAKSFYTLNLTGTAGVTMTDSGSLTLLGGGLIGNTSGTISGGILAGSAGGDLVVITPANLTISSMIGNNGGATGLTKAGSGALTLLGSNTYSGLTTIGAGTLQVGNGGKSGTLGSGLVLNDGSLLSFNLSSTYAVPGAISGPGPLTQLGPGALVLNAGDSYTGPTTISGGALRANSGAGLPAGSNLTLNGGVLESNGSASFTRSIGPAAGEVQWSGSGGGFSANGGTLTVNLNAGATLTWGGSATQIAGALLFGSSTANDATNFLNPINLNSSGGSLNCTVQVAAGLGGDFALLSGGLSNSAGTAGLVKTGNGLLELAGASSYNGGMQIDAGNVVFTSLAAVPSGSGSILINAPGALNVAGAISSVTSLLGSGTLSVNSNGALALSGASNQTINMGGYSGLSLGAVAAGATYSGALTPSGSTYNLGGGGGILTVSGNLTGAANSLNIAGSVVLSGANTYGGGTTISSGTAQFNSSAAVGGSGASVSVAPGATLAAGYAMNQAFLGRISPASSANAFTIALAASSSNPLSFSTASLTLASLGATGTQVYSGTLTPSGSTYRLGGGGGTLDVTSNLTGADSLLVGSTGPGTVALSGSNTYTGGTIVSSGTLDVLNNLALSDGALTVGAGANLLFASPTQSPMIEELDFLSPSASELNAGGLPSLSTAAAASPSVLPASTQPGASPVPEPNALVLLLAAGGVLWWCRRPTCLRMLLRR